MWDPFRYKLGGRLINAFGEEFTSRYGVNEDGRYVLTRDLATYAIVKEIEAGRGSPHGGAYLSFTHCTEAALREAFGPVIDRLAKNAIDLTKMPVEVAPIAHYHMGGVVADRQMATEIPGLLVAGEAAGGANGANRLSGNAVTEALVFGRRAGRSAAAQAHRLRSPPFSAAAAKPALDLVSANGTATDGSAASPNSAAMIVALQSVMADFVGPFRTHDKLVLALAKIADLTRELGEHPLGGGGPFDMRRIDWFDLRNMLIVARTVAAAALRRTESRGAHQREDFPGMLLDWRVNQTVRLSEGSMDIASAPVTPSTPPPPSHRWLEASAGKAGAMAATP
jgi:succinate dehydrogenase/fumarate reductase flavoprotein subunit